MKVLSKEIVRLYPVQLRIFGVLFSQIVLPIHASSKLSHLK